MAETIEHKIDEEKKPDAAIPATSGEALSMRGRFARYNSPFLQLMIPLLTTRYVWLAIEDINPLNFLKKPDPSKFADGVTPKPDFKPWVRPTTTGYIRRNFAALGMGSTLLGVIAYYSKRTYDDIRTLYAEAVGYELNKKPEEVGWKDIFINSKNAALGVTRNAFITRTITRVGAGSAFLVPWHALRDHPHGPPKYDANANAGVGAVGVYLSLDGFVRTQTFFEAEQNLADSAIHHSDAISHEIFKPKHIQTLLLLQRTHLNKNYKWPDFRSPEGENQVVLSSRIADLMNQTYDNAVKTENANFTIGKFNYLIGFGLLEDFPTSLAFVELANKSSDMKEVKAAAAGLKCGRNPKAIFQEFGIDIDALVRKNEPSTATSEPAAAKFTSAVPSAKDRLPQAARTLQDFAAQIDAPRQVNQ